MHLKANIKYVEVHMFMVFLKLEKETLNLIPVDASVISKTKEEKEIFNQKLQNLQDTTATNK